MFPREIRARNACQKFPKSAQVHQASGQGNEEHCEPAYLKDNFRPERGPPQWDGAEAGEEAYERAVVSHIEREARRGLLESIC